MFEMNKLELIDHFFHPKNITLIGVSRNLMGPSGMILGNMLRSNYKGPLYLINPKVEEGKKILGKPVKRSLNEIGTNLDLVFVIVPSRIVPEVLENCGQHNARAVVIISAGFAESISYDKEKIALQDETVRIARKNGFVFAGPNCNGIYSDAISLNAIFGPRVRCLSGNISYVTRGGTAGIHSLIQTRVRGIGVSKLINLGDSACLKIQDLIEYYGQDPETKIIGAYTEGFDDGKSFISIVEKVTAKKPVVFYKSGETIAGQRAALSHVGAIAGKFSSRIFEGVASQAGLIPVESIDELVDVCTSFMITHVPKGRNVGIITPAGSFGVMASDACNKEGLNVPPLNPETLQKIDRLLPEYWSHNNPVDLTDSMNFSVFGKIIRIVLEEETFDGLIILFSDISDNQGTIMDFSIGENLVDEKSINFFADIVKQQIKRISRYIEKVRKPVFFLGPVQAQNGLPDFLREHKIIVLPEFRRIARTFRALVKWNELKKKIRQ